ncbi:TonB-dependent receptor [Croceicoccus ponticola]|uniref:TonB-dependent receptor n=1 Tax=Croceicoccus ponticola TaxID=2217664 RepID=A0A437GXN4_9SPHN|nr:TonB-dependent receptor [Croceicoccus ponticola]RVQ65996.1 TonB-dependent receptor [Croceicoccus ponticola]
MKTLLLRSVALVAVAMPIAAHAQSTGSQDFENEILVTGARTLGVEGIELPDTPKAKQVLGAEAIRRARPGQAINDIVNLVPGVSFQNNDPWGASGGGFTIRGFGSDRVSQTVDGIPLNDSGNYALYTSQLVDSEVLESVNVNLGTTDVDSPTASATGGTINLRTRKPGDDFGIMTTMTYGDVLSKGDYESSRYMRGFAMIDTGDITGNGLKAFGSVSYTNYGVPFNPAGEVNKTQVNARIYQDLGDNGDFLSLAGMFNWGRNNFFGSEDIGTLLGYYDGEITKRDRFTLYEASGEYPCSVPDGQVYQGGGIAGVQERYDDRNGCGAAFYRRYNPSDTGNIRAASRFTLSDSLVFTFEPSYQYVKANGGGPDDLREQFYTSGGQSYVGAFGGGYYFGQDLNGDGDLLDRVAGNDPSQTRTDRYGVVSNLIYDLSPEHRVRFAYTYDRARHRQTGELSPMFQNGTPGDYFPMDNPLTVVDGIAINKRDRLSYATLHQFSGEYRGKFMEDRLTTVLGLRMPFFKRELNQNCYTTSISGFVDCPNAGQDLTAYEAANPGYALPQTRTYKYDEPLPNIGLTFDVTNAVSLFANYAKGLSVPGTDPLYDSLYLDENDKVKPVPETTDSFDLGMRFREGRLTAQFAGWYTRYNDRLASAFDPDANDGDGATVYRNLGKVEKYGIDGSIAYSPSRNTLLYVFGSLSKSKIADDVLNGFCDAGDVTDMVIGCGAVGDPLFLQTGGNSESGTPNYSYGARGQVALGALELGAQVKRTGKRWVNDTNQDRVPAYTLVDLDARYVFAEGPTGGDVALQLNVSNLFDEYYVGSFGGTLSDFGTAQIGSPRAASMSLIIGY